MKRWRDDSVECECSIAGATCRDERVMETNVMTAAHKKSKRAAGAAVEG